MQKVKKKYKKRYNKKLLVLESLDGLRGNRRTMIGDGSKRA